MKKRLLSIIMTAAMLLTLITPAVPAMAADTDVKEEQSSASAVAAVSDKADSRVEEATRFEAEYLVTNSETAGVVSESLASENYSGGYAIGGMNYREGQTTRTYFESQYNAEKDGTYMITIGYSAVKVRTYKWFPMFTSPSIKVQLNEDKWISMTAPVTDALDSMDVVSLLVDMKQGENTIRFSGLATAENEVFGYYKGVLDYLDVAYVNPAKTTEDKSGASKEVLNELGFSLNENSYRTDELSAGNHMLTSRSQIVTESYSGATTSRKTVGVSSGNYDVTAEGESENSDDYKLSATFDPDGDGNKEYIARLSLEEGSRGGSIRMSVEKIDGTHDVFRNVDTGGYIDGVNASYGIEKQEVLGLMNIVAGDFDGDGKDELAIYAPNNQVEDDQGTPAREEIKIYDIDVESDSTLPEPAEVIDITEGTTKWSKTICGDKKQYYSLPYLSMTADDANGDGIDDLLTVANFPEYHSSVSGGFNGYTWSQVLNADTCFASVLDVYEGRKNADIKQTVKKRPLIGKTGDTGAYVLRNATAIVGNVTGSNSRDIVLAGNYTEINYSSDTTTTSVVAYTTKISTRLSTLGTGIGSGGIRIAYIIAGFTDYGTLTRNTVSSSSLRYTWNTAAGNSNLSYSNQFYRKQGKRLYSYAAEPVAVAAFAAFGSSLADVIFVDGTLFEYDTEGKLGEISFNPLTDMKVDKKYDGNRWVISAVAGNTSNSEIGAETLQFIYVRESVAYSSYRNPSYEYFRVVVSGKLENGEKGYSSSNADLGDHRCSINLANLDNNNSYISFQNGDTDIYYGDIEVYSILQAAPVWKELGDDNYAEKANTSYSKSSGSGSGTSDSVSVSAGVVMGFEQEVSLLGLFKVGGMDFETTVSASVGHSSEQTVSREFSTAYDTSGTEDVVVLFTVPYVRYNCKMYLPSYYMPRKAEYQKKLAFQQELEKNLLEYVDKGVSVVGGTYSKPTDSYNRKYTTDVTSSNYSSQVALNNNYIEWLEMTESNIAELGGGGIYHWGTYMAGGWQDYYYSIPQTPILTTVDVSTYDQIAAVTPELEPIYGNIFDEEYVPGDPSTYPRNTNFLKVSSGSKVMTGQTNVESNADVNGFITSSSISAAGSAPSQSITVSKEDSRTVTYGASVETTLIAKAGGVKAGAAFSMNKESSNCWTTSEGNTYTGTVPNLPKGTSGDYSYGWKMVVYDTTLNGKPVPVVGYLTRLTQTPPPSVPTDITVTGRTDSSVELQWSEGNRPAAAYDVYRVRKTNSGLNYMKIGSVSEKKSGMYSFTDDNSGDGLSPNKTYYYALKAVSDNGIASAYSELVTATTLAADLDLKIALTGMDNEVTYLAGKDMPLTVDISSQNNTKYRVLSYSWQSNTGNGWKKLKGSSDSDTYLLRTSTTKNGYQYRCMLNIQIGSDADGDIIDWYTNVVTQQARRVGSVITFADGEEASSQTDYVKQGTETDVAVQLVPESDTMEAIDGNMTFQVKHYGTDPESAVTETYEAKLEDDCSAHVNLAFDEAGYYEVSAVYGGNRTYDEAVTNDPYIYQVYEDNGFDFAAAEIKLDDTYTVGSEDTLSCYYTGEQICPKVMVTYNEETLTEGEDYTVTYGENVQAGGQAGDVTITPAGRFAHQKPVTATFDIWKNFDAVEAVFADGEVYLDAEDNPYVIWNNEECKPEIRLCYDGEELIEGQNYEVSYDNNAEAGARAEISITGTGVFRGADKQMYFDIKDHMTIDLARFTGLEKDADYLACYSKVAEYDADTETLKLLAAGQPVEITGTNENLVICPESGNTQIILNNVTFRQLDLTELKSDVEIVLDGTNRITASEKDVPAVLAGGLAEAPVMLTFQQRSYTDDSAEHDRAVLILGGGENAPAVSNAYGRVIFRDARYELNAGDGQKNAVCAESVMIKGAEISANVDEICSVKPIDGDISFAKAAIQTVDGKTSYMYTGSTICPDIQVSLNGAVLKKDVDYSVTYGSNTEAGTGSGTITVTPKGFFEGETALTIHFDITKPEPEKPKPVKVTKLTISGESKKIAAGRKLKLTCTVAPKNAANKSVKWVSSNTKYATVTAGGVVTTKSAGAGKSVTITAIAKDGSGRKATYKISIVKHIVRSVTITNKVTTVKPGKSVQLRTKVVTSGKTANTALVWTSSNPKYMTVTSKGLVKAAKNAKGKTVRITASALDGSGRKASITIKIK